MKRGCVIGYDINEKGCQISYYDDSMEEPDTKAPAAMIT